MPVLGRWRRSRLPHDWHAELDQKEAELRQDRARQPAWPPMSSPRSKRAIRLPGRPDLRPRDLRSRTSSKVITALDDTMAELFHSLRSCRYRCATTKITSSCLFPGGRGRLRLEDPDNLLETGVVIDAQPAGKKLTATSACSPAASEVWQRSRSCSPSSVPRPSPFYVLDEVEAALTTPTFGASSGWLMHCGSEPGSHHHPPATDDGGGRHSLRRDHGTWRLVQGHCQAPA